jgi:nitroimidazol reductase NimA-like FMN-containing flavoprotein (pyridoxamine 5'-phosphate oxidase superfamily)
MQLADPRTGIVALDRRECFELLGTVPLGRVVTVVGGSPHIVTVNFTVDAEHEGVVFRTDVGTTLRAAERGRVAFQADHYDAEARKGWSVVIHGEAEEVVPAPTGLPVDPWAGGEKAHWVRIRATAITGRRV